MNQNIIKGQLCQENGQSFIASANNNYFEDRLIWQGYLTHWLGQKVVARELPQLDYDSSQPIIILWPDEPPPEEPCVDFYYNERLVKYPASLFGHNAININGNIYNFSHLLNENEIMTPEEYFYRPALGEFAPSPVNGKFEILANGTAYYDKFGRNFMRTVHVLRIRGMDTKRLSSILDEELEIIQVMDDLRSARVDFLTIGQYLQPSVKHFPLQRYYDPIEFKELETIAKAKGFLLVSSSPLTRSSYHADEDFALLKKNRKLINAKSISKENH